MALQLTEFMGATAFPDRMGDYYPAYVESGRIVQGHAVSGCLPPQLMLAVDRDLADPTWRSMFHQALLLDNRFQRGLLNASELEGFAHRQEKPAPLVASSPPPRWEETSYTVDQIKRLSRKALSRSDNPMFEYGWALVKTSAALCYTIRLCEQLHTDAVTDSLSHYQLLAQTCQREHLQLSNVCIRREGY